MTPLSISNLIPAFEQSNKRHLIIFLIEHCRLFILSSFYYHIFSYVYSKRNDSRRQHVRFVSKRCCVVFFNRHNSFARFVIVWRSTFFWYLSFRYWIHIALETKRYGSIIRFMWIFNKTSLAEGGESPFFLLFITHYTRAAFARDRIKGRFVCIMELQPPLCSHRSDKYHRLFIAHNVLLWLHCRWRKVFDFLVCRIDYVVRLHATEQIRATRVIISSCSPSSRKCNKNTRRFRRQACGLYRFYLNLCMKS